MGLFRYTPFVLIKLNKIMKAVSFKIVAITDVTIRNILQNASCEALGLYTAYFEIAKWQETYRVKATTGFMVKRTGWSKNKVIKYKKQLIQLGVIKDYKTIGEDGQVKGHYIEILHLVDDIPHSQNPEGGFHHGWKNETQVLSTGSLSANNKIKVQSDNSDVKERFDKFRMLYKNKLKGKAKSLDSEYKNFKSKNPKLNNIEGIKHVETLLGKFYHELQAQEDGGKKDAFNYVPHLSTYINQKRWEHYEK
jgi:hypothetical protein